MTIHKKILIVGQTPPPYHGQALSTKSLLEGNYSAIRLYHIRLSFSSSIDQVGKFRMGKVLHLLKVILKIFYWRIRYGIGTLYFMPVGNHKIPFYRDMIILLSTKWVFKEIVYHFRVGGLLQYYQSLPGILKFLFRLTYYKPDLAIKLSENGTNDDECFKAKKIKIIPNGIRDDALTFQAERFKKYPVPTVLYIGAISESKGIYTLLNIVKILKQEIVEVNFRVVGEFSDKVLRKKIYREIKNLSIGEMINFVGQKIGNDKLEELAKAHIFCFPSQHETFGRVLLEAMQFRLPVVASNVGGIPSIVMNNITGFLVHENQPDSFAEKIKFLILNPQIMAEMGEKGREIFKNKFTEELFHHNMENVLCGMSN
jgi:glycosyltransferase involved in cell wall biosynthesis